MKKLYPKDSTTRSEVLEFFYDVKKKHFAVVTKGQGEIVDYCIITSDYYWKDNKSKDVPKHRRDVVYLNIGPIAKSAFHTPTLLNDFIPTLHKITDDKIG